MDVEYIKEFFQCHKPKCFNVSQKDYDFILIESNVNIKTSDEVQRIANRLSFNFERTERFEPVLKDFRLKYTKPKEVILIGCSYCVSNPIGKKILDFDYKKYLSNKNEFIKKYPDLDYQVENLFEHNLKLISDFFLTDVAKIKEGKLNIKSGMQKRLMFNINNKQLNK